MHQCPVCGFCGLNKPPYMGEYCSWEELPSFETCDSCGFEFGYDDLNNGETFESYRWKWQAGGCEWWSKHNLPPQGWDVTMQLQDLDSRN